MQIVNGCYYRVLVAYETSKLSNTSKILFWNKKSYENKKNLEIYEFYVSDQDAENVVIAENDKNIALVQKSDVRSSRDIMAIKQSLIRIRTMDGISVSFLSVDTDAEKDDDGNIVFLKNIGDLIGLWFNLEQDIEALNGKIYVLKWSEIVDEFSKRDKYLLEKLRLEEELWLKKHDAADKVVDDVINNSATLEEPLIPKKTK